MREQIGEPESRQAVRSLRSSVFFPVPVTSIHCLPDTMTRIFRLVGCMLAHCSNPECSLQFAADMATCPCCGHVRGDSVVHSAIEIEPSSDNSANSLANTSLPIAWHCPNCGDSGSFATSTGARFTVRRPRQCFSCGTVYFRPTSRPVSVLLIVIGLLLTFGAIFASVDLARQGNFVATITNSPIIPVGIVTTYFGFRFLFAGREAAPTATRMDDIYID